MKLYLFIALIQILIPSLIIIIIVSIFNNDGIKKRMFKSEMKKNIKNEYNSEFESVYNQLINSDLTEAQEEKNKNIMNCVIAGVLLGIIIIYIISISIYAALITEKASDANTFILSIPSILLGIVAVMLYLKKKTVKYKEKVIKNFIYFIKSDIEYEAGNKTHTESKIYSKAEFRDPFSNSSYITDIMKYSIDTDTDVQLEDLCLNNYSSGDSSNSKEVFNGIIVQISRKGIGNENILIERNKLFKSSDRIEDTSAEFEKYFDLCSTHDVSLIITESVKEKLVSLYKKYKIMFEVSIKGNSIYIRFFTGKMFEANIFGALINKNKLYEEYIIFTNILNIISEINQLFVL